MKKFIAVVLAVILTFSVGASAFAVQDIPPMPTQTDGKVIIAAESTYIEAGQSYKVPVSIISKYTPAITTGSFAMGFEASIGGIGSQYVTLDSIEFSSEIMAYNGFTEGECFYDVDDTGFAYCSFRVGDLGLLNQTKFTIAYVNITVSPDFPGGEVEAIVDITPYNLAYVGGILDVESVGTATIIDEDSNETDLINGEDVNTDEIYFDACHMIQEPERPSAKDLFLAQVKRLALQALSGLIMILELLENYLKTV